VPPRALALKRFALSQSIVSGSVAIGDITTVSIASLLPFLVYVQGRQPASLVTYLAVTFLFGFILVQTLVPAGFYHFERIARPTHHLGALMLRTSAAFALLLALAFALKVSESVSRF